MNKEKVSVTMKELSDRDKELILFGISMGRDYWDGYYGSDQNILKMLEDEPIVLNSD